MKTLTIELAKNLAKKNAIVKWKSEAISPNAAFLKGGKYSGEARINDFAKSGVKDHYIAVMLQMDGDYMPAVLNSHRGVFLYGDEPISVEEVK